MINGYDRNMISECVYVKCRNFCVGILLWYESDFMCKMGSVLENVCQGNCKKPDLSCK